MGKILKALGVVSGVVILVPPLRHHFDQKIFKHVRNYNTSLNQRNKFSTEEEFHDFLGNLGHGIVTFFDTKYWSNNKNHQIYDLIGSINTTAIIKR